MLRESFSIDLYIFDKLMTQNQQQKQSCTWRRSLMMMHSLNLPLFFPFSLCLLFPLTFSFSYSLSISLSLSLFLSLYALSFSILSVSSFSFHSLCFFLPIFSTSFFLVYHFLLFLFQVLSLSLPSRSNCKLDTIVIRIPIRRHFRGNTKWLAK